MPENSNGLKVITPTPPQQPQAPNAKWCHRFFIPMTFAEQRPNPLNPREMMVEPKANAVFVRCLGAECTLWDEHRKQCADRTKAIALEQIAVLLEKRNALEERRELSETMSGLGT